MYVGAEGKVLYAGPGPEKTTEEGANKEGKLPEKESTAVCFNTPLLQRKLQQLEKQSRPFDVYTAGSKNPLLLLESRSMNNASVICYKSKGPVQMLNCRAKSRTDGSLIECRHLAYAYATGGFGLKTNVTQGEPKEPGGKFNAVASIENIQSNEAIKTDKQLEKTPIRSGIPKVAVYFDAEHFGQALYGVWMKKGAGDQASHGEPSQTWFLSTENHVMVIKLMPTAGSAIKIEWYDPNSTTIVQRAIVSNAEMLKQLTLNQFVSMSDQKTYAIDQGQAVALTSADAVEVENDSDATVLGALTPSLLHALMRHGQLNNSSMDSLKTTLSEVRSDNLHELIVLLCANCGTGTPGLFMALQNSHQEAISAYFRGIKQFGDLIEPEVIKALFAARDKNGTPGLFMALQNGHQEAVSAYIEGIKQFRDIIEPGVIWELLLAKREDGKPGLLLSLADGHQGAISAYLEGIRQFADIIEPKFIKELLASKDGNGTPGLFMALQCGHQGAISAYLEGIKKFRDIIDSGAIWELITAKNEKGTPGLFVALGRDSHQEAVSAYTRGMQQFRQEAVRE